MPRPERLLTVHWILRTLILLAVCFVLLALFGCAPVKQEPVTPHVVTQTVTKYVSVPDDLTTPCPIDQPKARTVAEAVRVARARKDALITCNKQLDAIRSLGK
ncbi:hypothetical protein SAMN04487785_1136 [Dyella jiangningensis]|uniref:Rz1-like lysis system protein LysC n=1 Tax=Dyella sp. AtDHG13 TaxID=1938897 RepID=UPI000880DDAF|nr:hypothetical protein [Dyella sp. AtDHG13]PXV60900.1 hypothetical protein BDW41_102631 [Dyella sp. AtDHG13]SDK93891.1 hypothetical protein SAMN04487785_1136 [Dyella jiangningensis]